VACAAAIAFLKVLQKEHLVEKCQEKGEYFKKKIEELKEKYPKFIKEARIMGLMVGLEIEKDGPEVVKKCVNEGILMNCTAGNVLRFLPPLIVEEKEIDHLMEILDKVFKEINK